MERTCPRHHVTLYFLFRWRVKPTWIPMGVPLNAWNCECLVFQTLELFVLLPRNSKHVLLFLPRIRDNLEFPWRASLGNKQGLTSPM